MIQSAIIALLSNTPLGSSIMHKKWIHQTFGCKQGAQACSALLWRGSAKKRPGSLVESPANLESLQSLSQWKPLNVGQKIINCTAEASNNPSKGYLAAHWMAFQLCLYHKALRNFENFPTRQFQLIEVILRELSNARYDPHGGNVQPQLQAASSDWRRHAAARPSIGDAIEFRCVENPKSIEDLGVAKWFTSFCQDVWCHLMYKIQCQDLKSSGFKQTTWHNQTFQMPHPYPWRICHPPQLSKKRKIATYCHSSRVSNLMPSLQEMQNLQAATGFPGSRPLTQRHMVVYHSKEPGSLLCFKMF